MYKLTGIFYLPSRGGCHIVDFLCKLLCIYGNENMFFFINTIKCKPTENIGLLIFFQDYNISISNEHFEVYKTKEN